MAATAQVKCIFNVEARLCDASQQCFEVPDIHALGELKSKSCEPFRILLCKPLHNTCQLASSTHEFISDYFCFHIVAVITSNSPQPLFISHFAGCFILNWRSNETPEDSHRLFSVVRLELPT